MTPIHLLNPLIIGPPSRRSYCLKTQLIYSYTHILCFSLFNIFTYQHTNIPTYNICVFYTTYAIQYPISQVRLRGDLGEHKVRNICTHTHTYIHLYIYTHIHTHTPTYLLPTHTHLPSMGADHLPDVYYHEIHKVCTHVYTHKTHLLYMNI
jgi:hypothetical protein